MQRFPVTLALGVAFALSVLAPPVDARPAERDEAGAGHAISRHADELGLDDETRSQIEAIATRTQRESDKLRRAHHQAGRTLHDLLELDDPDTSAVMSQADVVGQLESQRRKLRLGALLEIRALLTPEQRRQLVEIRNAERPDRPSRQQRRERMRACRPDVEKLCSDADHPRRVMRCLSEQREALSNDCGAAFDSLRAEHEDRPSRRPPWRD